MKSISKDLHAGAKDHAPPNRQTKTYHIKGHSFTIETAPNVFVPSDWASKMMECLTIPSNCKLIDIGTGTGVIGVYASLLGADVYATDVSAEATVLAHENAVHNGVSMHCYQGQYFADFDMTFDVITVNLPQEIVPLKSDLDRGYISTVRGGDKGNELLIEFLRQAPKHMSRKSKILMPVCSLSYYLDTFRYINQSFEVRLLNVFEVKTKGYVRDFSYMYKTLNEEGYINVFKRENDWFHLLYIMELTKN